MKFAVSRTSLFNKDTPPCPEAVRGVYLEREYVGKGGFVFSEGMGDWYEVGSNHGDNEEYYYRDLEIEGWILNFEGLEQLITFIQKHGNVVVKQIHPSTFEIEIYDTYRE